MGWHSTLIHGKDCQNAKFGSGNKPILVATDVATQRLDVPDVVHVVNYDLPNGIVPHVSKHDTSLKKHRSIAKPLVELLVESNQEVSSWLIKYAALQQCSAHASGPSQRADISDSASTCNIKGFVVITGDIISQPHCAETVNGKLSPSNSASVQPLDRGEPSSTFIFMPQEWQPNR